MASESGTSGSSAVTVPSVTTAPVARVALAVTVARDDPDGVPVPTVPAAAVPVPRVDTTVAVAKVNAFELALTSTVAFELALLLQLLFWSCY